MTDTVAPEVRSRMMAGIRGRDTKPEMLVRSFLHRSGLRFRLHAARLPGRPDLVFPRFRSVLFVNGCFWHRHAGCRFASTPSSNPAFWLKKFNDNIERDRASIEKLVAMGWRVLIVWECGLRQRDVQQSLAWLPSEIREGSTPVLEWPKA
jgi:DNA mismatch endonuclease (patch repair protein)